MLSLAIVTNIDIVYMYIVTDFFFFYIWLSSVTLAYSRSNRRSISLLYGGLFVTSNLSPEWFIANDCGRRIPSSLVNNVLTNEPSFVNI
jgi:hypothetical protein